uniref:Abnormal cell migration protein 18-like fibronectin type I domain-containing protein n=1 Tax=Romanomermis culicivorax TaxID=13658 RepID=A0A915KH42_ROMCU
MQSAVAAVDDRSRKCPGGHDHGQTVDRGRYWYKCNTGHLEPMGCFADDGTRLDIMGAFRTRGYVLQCVLDYKGDLAFRYKGCLSDDQKEYAPNETWQDERYWYVCMVHGEYLRSEVGGCVHQNNRYGIGATIEKKGFLYECRRYGNSTGSFCPVACLHQGRRYDVDQTFEIGKYWYTCTIYNGRLAKVCVGCLHKEKRLKDGDRYFQRDSVYECEIRNNTLPEHRLIGCRDDLDGVVVERKLGCMWTVGRFPTQYVMQCVPKHARLAVKEVVKCYYKGYEMNPGCFRIVDDEVITCRKNAGGAVTIERIFEYCENV